MYRLLIALLLVSMLPVGGRHASNIVVSYYENGALYRETHVRNGQKDGFENEYGLTGHLRARWNYHEGKKHGVQQGWFEEGPKRFEYHYEEGLLDGEQTEWHMGGGIFRRQLYTQGVETDKKILFSGGELFSNYSIKNGRTFGLDGGALCFDPKKEGDISLAP